MYLLALFAVLGTTAHALGDLAHLFLNIESILKQKDAKEVCRGLVKVAALPPKLISVLRRALDDHYSPSFIANVAEKSFDNLDAAQMCSADHTSLKDYQSCLLCETGMNPLFIHLLNCMGQYEKWHKMSPITNEEKRTPGHDFDASKAWSMARFKKTILGMDESMKNEFRRCSKRINEEYTMSVPLKSLTEVAAFEDVREMQILAVFNMCRPVLIQVPLPLNRRPIVKPSDMVPIVLKNFLARGDYQSIIDAMNFDWASVPQETLRMSLECIKNIHAQRSRQSEYFAGIKYFDYLIHESKGIISSWWTPFYRAMLPVSGFADSLLRAIAKSQYLPDALLPQLMALQSELHEKSLGDILDKVRRMVETFMKNTLRSHYLISDDSLLSFSRKFRLSSYTSQLEIIGPKLNKLFELETLRLPDNAETLDSVLLTTFLESRSPDYYFDIALLLLHPGFMGEADFMNNVMRLLMENHSVSDIVSSLWGFHDPSTLSNYEADLQNVLHFPQDISLEGSLDELKERAHEVLVTAIVAEGGEEFSQLSYLTSSAFPEIISLLIQIHNYIGVRSSSAYWLAAGLPIFASPTFPADYSKSVMGMIMFLYRRGLNSIPNDAIRTELLNNVSLSMFYRSDNEDRFTALDIPTIKSMISLVQGDPFDFTEAVARTPGIFTDINWIQLTRGLIGDMVVPDSVGDINTVNDYDSALSLLRSIASSFVDLDNVFLPLDRSIELLRKRPDCCPICLQAFMDATGDVLLIPDFGALNPCHHIYHKACFKESCQYRLPVSCPTCRQSVFEVDTEEK